MQCSVLNCWKSLLEACDCFHEGSHVDTLAVRCASPLTGHFTESSIAAEFLSPIAVSRVSSPEFLTSQFRWDRHRYYLIGSNIVAFTTRSLEASIRIVVLSQGFLRSKLKFLEYLQPLSDLVRGLLVLG